VTVDSRFHHITAAGLAPLPVQRPIPIWIGAFVPAALRRVGRLADGWFPMARPGAGLDEALEIVAEGAREVGRDPSTIAFEGRVDYSAGGPERVAEHAARWSAAGASHVSVNTMRAGLEGVDAHIAALTSVAALVL
jgi:alkanesulfonate monooxygenase SsuD/methylene tetrahydromethanopterin reductase-like flavin-dependent oxidoreductase (luciferase family)